MGRLYVMQSQRRREPERISDLRRNEVVTANLPGLGYVGLLYLAGYETNPDTKEKNMVFFGIRKGVEEMYAIPSRQLRIINGILTQKEHLHAVNSLMNIFEKLIHNKISREKALESLEGKLKVKIFPAERCDDFLYKSAREALQMFQKFQRLM